MARSQGSAKGRARGAAGSFERSQHSVDVGGDGRVRSVEQVLDEESAKSEQFKKVSDNWRTFRAEQHRWFSIADARTEMSVYALTAAASQ